MASTGTYSLLNCSILYGGVLDGFADGDAISIEPLGDRWVELVGSDGSILRVDTGQKAFTVTINLMQSSSSNAILMACYLADTETPGGVLLPFTYKDPNANDAFFSPKTWIKRLPTMGRGNKGNMQTWTLIAADGVFFAGGIGTPL